MNRSSLLAAAGMIALAAQLSGADASAPSDELRSHPDFDLYSAAIADGSIESLQRFLVDRPASPFVGAVFAQMAQQIGCDSSIPGSAAPDPSCGDRSGSGSTVAAIY